jgi:hypothetical protein
MQLDQSFGQGQPKPQAALAAIERGIGLREWLKQCDQERLVRRE